MLALHRKYRPQTVAELDQQKAKKIFQQILKTGNFSQAYLFTGPKGTGKTTAARLLAKVINCEKNRPDPETGKLPKSFVEPCNTCSVCVSITQGSSSGVVEMDAASNRGIDDIRSLRDQINLIPPDTSYAVYIIDEVHMLTTEAFNALLKTLEEPPAHAVFCLATTEFHKLPETITSRCTIVSYKKSSDEEISRSLERVAEGEKLDISEQALSLIAHKADGSFRDALNILQSLMQEATKIDEATVETFAGASSTQLIKDFVAALYKADVQAALGYIDQASEQNLSMEHYAKAIVEHAVNQTKEAINSNQAPNQLDLDLVNIFSQSFSRFSLVPIPELPLEMAAIEFCLKHGTLKATQPTPPQQPPQNIPTTVAQAASVKETTPMKQAQTKSEGQPLEEVQMAKAPTQESVAPPQIQMADAEVEESQVTSNWQKVLSQIAQHNHGLVTVLRRGRVIGCNGNTITIGVSYEFHKQQLEQDRYIQIVENCLAEVFGGRVRMVVQLEEKRNLSKQMKTHNNLSGEIKSADNDLVSAVEDAFGV